MRKLLYCLFVLFPVFLMGQNTHYFSKILSNDTIIMLSTCVLPIDSGYLVTGIYNPTPILPEGQYTKKIFLQKLDSLGNETAFYILDSETPEETRQLTAPDRGNLFIKCSDGNYLIVYTSIQSQNSFDKDVNYIKFTKSGEIIWQKTIDTPTHQVIQSVIETSDNSFFLAGFNTFPEGTIGNFYAIKTDSLGEVEWELTQSMGTLHSAAFSCVEDTDGGFVLGGYASHPGTGFDIQLLKLDINGNYVWEKNYDVNGWAECAALLTPHATGYIISTCTLEPNGNFDDIEHHYILSLDQDFEKEWDVVYPAAQEWFALESDPVINDDGSFVQTGRSKPYTSIPFIRKFSPTGAIEWTWSETYDESSSFRSRDLEKTEDGGYVMAAFQFTNWQRGWLVKIDSMGNTCFDVGCDSTVIALPIDTSSMDTTIIDTSSTDTTIIDTGSIDTTIIDTTNTVIDALNHLSPYFVRISPNPVKDQAMLLYELPSMAPYADFRLFNSKGAPVLKEKIATMQYGQALDFGHLSSGIYIWELTILGQKVQTGKVLVD